MKPVPKTRSIANSLALLAGLALFAAAHEVAARPGGGQSYSGGGSHSYGGSSHSYGGSSSSSHSYSSSGSSYSGGGGGGDGFAILLVVLGAVAFVAYHARSQESAARFDSAPAQPTAPARRGAQLAKIRERDPEFSSVLFEDFVYALYARVQAARGDPRDMAALAPYVGEAAREQQLAREPAGVKIHGVVIGKLEVARVVDAASLQVELVFEANYTAELASGAQGYYAEERWTLERAHGVTSKPPGDVHSFQCPSCGGPYERSDAGRCSRCAQVVEGGRFDWSLASVRVLRQEQRGPALTSDVQEQGTHLPSVLEPAIDRRYVKFAAEDPGASLEVLERRVRQIFAVMNAGWSACDLRPVRPHVSDAFYNYLSYWVDAYKAQGLRNAIKDAELSQIQVVKLARDRHYDAITLRIWARCIDTTVAADDGRLVSGNPRRARAYSEYWTLIRGAGVRGVPRSARDCPNCGAPLDRVNMAGNCEYCGAHLTRGEFDWVLAKIEQDESYSG